MPGENVTTKKNTKHHLIPPPFTNKAAAFWLPTHSPTEYYDNYFLEDP